MLDTRIIRRLAYDGNYQRAIELIVDIIDGKKNYFEVKEDLEKRRKASSITTENARLKSCLQEIRALAEKTGCRAFIEIIDRQSKGRMNNFEKIKSLTLDEMAEYLTKLTATYCEYCTFKEF